MNPRIIALYLPQFHRIPENDTWWGEGFTEWTAVKNAMPLFPQHEQPNVPLNDNYYNLLDKKTMQWQASLMHKYGIDGMCMYHYYFKDGRKVLEKPAENLLRWKDINMPFCFDWANESWVRSWSKLKEYANPWSEKFETEKNRNECENKNGILLEQDYGDENAWRDHYNYLSPFFHDERYIKIGNSPVFVIYNPDHIQCLPEMKECFDKCAMLDGFDGVYLIGGQPEKENSLVFSLTMEKNPAYIKGKVVEKKFDFRYGVSDFSEYDDVSMMIIEHQLKEGECPCAFPGYDDTPRRGRGGSVVHGRNPEMFQEQMEQLLLKAKKINVPFVFINAWNEWGEGMYLEPDDRYGYSFLEAVLKARDNFEKGRVTDETEKPANVIWSLRQENSALKEQNVRYRDYWKAMDRILCILENGDSISGYLERYGKHETIIIYGMGMLGKHLFYLLQNANENITSVIDQKVLTGSHNYDGVPMYNMMDEIPYADMIIVTVMYSYDDIRRELKTKFPESCVVSIDDVIGK